MADAVTPKVCLAIPMPPPYGGIANWSRMVTSELRQRGVPFEVVDIAPRRRSVDGRSAYERFVVSGVDLIRIAVSVLGSIRNGCRCLHLTTSGQFAVVRDLVLLRLAKLMAVPTVYHVRFGRVPEIREQDTREWRWFRRAVSIATVTIAIDQTTFNALVQEFGPERVVCIPNPVDVAALPLPVPTPGKFVVYLGWVIPSKGVNELLTAWTDFFREHAEWRLRLIGPISDYYRSQLLDAHTVDGVEFFGEVDHNSAMTELAQSSIFVLPSHTEGFPNVLLEAMALGRASIATAVGAIPEMLSGGCGRVVRPSRSDELLAALLELASSESLRAEMGERSCEKVLAEYSMDAVMPQYMDLWKRILGWGA